MYAIIITLIMLFSNTCTTIPTHNTPSMERIEEDDPRWNCHTMGNLLCGPGMG